MDVSWKACRRRVNFQDVHFKIVDFTKEIVQIRPQNPKIFLAPSAQTPTKQGGGNKPCGGGINPRDCVDTLLGDTRAHDFL